MDQDRWQMAPHAVFLEHCARGELAYQVAGDGRALFPPRLAEPGTGAPLDWRISSGRGTVYATTTMHRRGEDPRNLVLVELEEGFRLMSRVEGVPPDAVRIGMPVRCVFVDDVPLFEPAP
jgi:uncharacterized OB-fold protein